MTVLTSSRGVFPEETPHPIAALPQDTLFQTLESAERRVIGRSYTDDLVVFDAFRSNRIDSEIRPYCEVARGLVMDRKTQEIVGLTVPAFSRLEVYLRDQSLPDEDFTATIKMDGSLGNAFFHKGEWTVSSRRKVDSSQGRWATKFLREHPSLQLLDPDLTYVFEIIHPQNRLVVDYGEKKGLVLLAVNNRANLTQLSYDAVAAEAQRTNLECVERVDLQTIDEIVHAASELSHLAEGYVVQFSSGLRIKIKGQEYDRFQKQLHAVNPKKIWNLFAYRQLDTFKSGVFPEVAENADRLAIALFRRACRVIGKCEYFLNELTNDFPRDMDPDSRKLLFRDRVRELKETELQNKEKHILFAMYKFRYSPVDGQDIRKLAHLIYQTLTPRKNDRFDEYRSPFSSVPGARIEDLE